MRKDYANIGERIKLIRKQLGYSQEKMALETGVTRDTVQAMESGKQRVAHDFLAKFVERTHSDLEYVVFGITANDTESDDYVIDVTERAAKAFQEKDLRKMKSIITELTKKYAAEKKISKERADYIDDVKTTLKNQFNL